MSAYSFSFAGEPLQALGAGALWWPAQQLLCVSDLHLAKSERQLRRGGSALPPYDSRDTLLRLSQLIDRYQPKTVICLGDSFDDDAAARALPDADHALLERLTQTRRWIWITGNHDPAPTGFDGEAADTLQIGPLLFRHIATPADTPLSHTVSSTSDASNGSLGEISGHYHPKVRLRGSSRPAFLMDQQRMILPAFGTYTGGLCSTDPALSTLMAPNALAVLTGQRPLPCPMPR
ncbi:ligase-associated DNA damage response endonuclease PdeM [Phaeobacter sp.]|uniref:ligase-associated DNA damage response endonuclease PdeM n=1 Tax=Phaeobacter sp. TaxID=1902409 RepID=UPI0025FB871C|nr:ligase-associated DNA damage response endonuclease PdeM [Phaeobacter sp.]